MTHLLALRGGAACGKQFVEADPDIKKVDCPKCLEGVRD